MSSAAPQPVLRRKVAAAREDQSLRAMSLPKALRLTAPKVANSLFGLPLAVIGVTEKRVTQSEAWALFSDETLLVLLDGPGGIVGAASLDGELVGALIQQQTTGQVGPAEDEKRAMTRTDAAMVAPLLDGILQRGSALMETEAERLVMQGFKFGARAEDSRMLSLALDASVFHVFKLSLDVGRGARQADFVLCLPVQIIQPPAPNVDEQSDPVDDRLDKIVMSVPTELTAVLCKLRLSLSELGRFQSGDIIPVAGSTIEKTGLHGQTGRKISQGKLGQSGGYRAVRLSAVGAMSKMRVESDEEEKDLAEPETAQAAIEETAITVDLQPELEQPLPELPPLDFDEPEPAPSA
ncbi:MAG: FliM/FliN family flagellar motor switch protein [Paracoccaceae bacterium]